MKNFVKISILFLLSIYLLSCSKKINITYSTVIIQEDSTTSKTTTLIKDTIIPSKKEPKKLSPFEEKLISYGLIDIKKLDSTIIVNLKYSSTDNFMHKDMYKDFDKAYLQKDVAEKLVKAQKYLKDTVPWYSLIIYDAVRPRIVQQWMWDSIKVPENVRYKYLSNPKYGSLHNFGAAVDVSIINDSTGEELDMGTPFDCFCELAYPYFEKKMLASGKLSYKAYKNRLLLRYVMNKAGFKGISTEWWHFNACSRKEAREKYRIIENFEGLKNDSVNITQTTENFLSQVNKKEIVYRIQIKISKKPLSHHCKCFKGLKVWQYYHDNYYKYTNGEFYDLSSAIKHKNKLKKMGFTDCFVVAFYKNKRISIKDIYKITEE